MEFKEIVLDIPESIKKVAAAVEKIESNSCLAGGFLSDLYMGTPYRDVDFFVKYPTHGEDIFFKNLQKALSLGEAKRSENIYYDTMPDLYSVYEATYDGFRLNFIFNESGKDSAKYFDLSLREFYYYGGKVYASEDAICDIGNKHLRAGMVNNPVVSMYRLASFKKRYGFSILEKYTEPIEETFSSWNYNIQNVKDILASKKMSDDVRNEVTQYFQNLSSRKINVKNGSLLSSYQRNKTITRQAFHDIFFQENAFSETFSFKIEHDFFLKKITLMEEEIKKEFHRQLIRLSIDFPELANELKNHYTNPSYFHYMFMPKLQKIATDFSNPKQYLQKLRTLIQELTQISHFSSHFVSSVDILIDQKEALQHDSLNASEYLNGQYVRLSIPGAVVSVYDLFNDKFLWHFNTDMLELIQEIIQQAIQSTKEKMNIEERKRTAV